MNASSHIPHPSLFRFRIVTYNVHKCRGLDRRTRPHRIVEVLREIDADVIALQEVLSVEDKAREQNQARFIAEELNCAYHFGENRKLQGGSYGNVTLSRLPIVSDAQNYDLTWRGREGRGCLRTEIEAGEHCTLQVFNVHLGTAFLERRHQARRLVDVLNDEMGRSGDSQQGCPAARVLLGDFNEWTRGLASRLFAAHLASADVRAHIARRRTYPGVLPLVHLDHVYYDARALELVNLTLHRSRVALIASDHLPLVADFRLQ